MGRAWGGAIPSRGTRVAVRCSGGSVVDLERHRVWPFQYAHPWLAKRSALSKRTRRNSYTRGHYHTEPHWGEAGNLCDGPDAREPVGVTLDGRQRCRDNTDFPCLANLNLTLIHFVVVVVDSCESVCPPRDDGSSQGGVTPLQVMVRC